MLSTNFSLTMSFLSCFFTEVHYVFFCSTELFLTMHASRQFMKGLQIRHFVDGLYQNMQSFVPILLLSMLSPNKHVNILVTKSVDVVRKYCLEGYCL